MAFPLIAAAFIAKKFAPKLIGLLGGNALTTAENILGVAGSVLGLEDPGEIMAAVDQGLSADQNAALQSKMIDLQATELEEETKRLQTVNDTYQKEIESKDPFISHWRPFFGYCVAITWVVLIFGLMVAVIITVWNKGSIAETIAALSSFVMALMPLYGIALAVLGVSVVKRSDDKQTAAGGKPTGILEMFRGKK